MASTISITVRLDQSRINAMLFDAGGASTLRAARKVEIRARAKAPFATGTLARSIVPRKIRSGIITEYKVGSDLPYAPYQEHGVPHRIYPVRAKALRFKPKGSNVFIFRAWTRGVPAVHFLRDAYQSLTFSDFLP